MLRSGVDYLPIARDFSNFREVLKASQDPSLVQRMTKSAWQNVVGSGRYTYACFVRSVEQAILDPLAGNAALSLWQGIAVRRAIARHDASWRFARYEAAELLPQRTAYETSSDRRWARERAKAARVARYAGLDLTLH